MAGRSPAAFIPAWRNDIRNGFYRLCLACVFTCGPAAATIVCGQEVYEQPAAATVAERCRAWLEQVAPAKLPEWDRLAEARTEGSSHTLSLIAEAAGLADPATNKLLDRLRNEPQYLLLSVLESHPLAIEDNWIRANLQLYLALELSQRQLYEEALGLLEQTEDTEVVDPASYFFHRAVCEHHLLHREPALSSLETLLTQCRPLPTRYRMLGELMRQDLSGLEEKSLNEISRKMRDVERRLDLGRSGQKVQKIEREIIDTLDELIAKLEQQAGGGGGGGSSQGQGNQPSSPAQDSRVKGSTAPGEVENKELGRKDGWGDLPPKEKAQAKQILGTMFPPHYQRAIEAYNKKNAQRENQKP
ncbi:MAG: hypothetical protein KDA76_08175 [Planctomycetaceae bacterium]|nr:hypothetical protein [Planctomycetaceae bacterium]